jgi:hypothetical protein
MSDEILCFTCGWRKSDEVPPPCPCDDDAEIECRIAERERIERDEGLAERIEREGKS